MVYLKRTLSILSLSFIILCAEFALAYVPQRGNVTAYLGPYAYRTNYNGNLSELNESNMGVSLVAAGDVSDHGALEMSAIYMHKFYFRDEDGGRSIAERTQAMHITIGYRRYWAPSFSTSVALYTSYPMGDPQTIHTDFTPAENIQTSARSASESGLDFALQVELWNSGLWGIMAEGRYSWAISKKPNEYSDQYGGMLAVRYFIQSRVEKPKTLQSAPAEKPPELKTAPEKKKKN